MRENGHGSNNYKQPRSVFGAKNHSTQENQEAQIGFAELGKNFNGKPRKPRKPRRENIKENPELMKKFIVFMYEYD